MRLFNFIKEQSAAWRFVISHSQSAAFAQPRAEQQAERFLRLVFAHVEADKFVRSKKKFRECQRDLRFANTRRAEEHKAAARTGWLGQSKLAPLQHGNHARYDMRSEERRVGKECRSRW